MFNLELWIYRVTTIGRAEWKLFWKGDLPNHLRAIDLVLSDGGRSIVVDAQIGMSHSCLDGWVR